MQFLYAIAKMGKPPTRSINRKVLCRLAIASSSCFGINTSSAIRTVSMLPPSPAPELRRYNLLCFVNQASLSFSKKATSTALLTMPSVSPVITA
jgi:hypothetical protein